MFRAEECSLIVPTYSAIAASYASLQLFPLLFEKFVINEILGTGISRDITRDDISKRVRLSISEISLWKCTDTKYEGTHSPDVGSFVVPFQSSKIKRRKKETQKRSAITVTRIIPILILRLQFPARGLRLFYGISEFPAFAIFRPKVRACSMISENSWNGQNIKVDIIHTNF